MKLNSKCMACQIRKQEAKIRHFNDEDRKKQYMEAIRQRFEHPKDDDCVPSISTELKKFYCSFWGVPMEDFTLKSRTYLCPHRQLYRLCGASGSQQGNCTFSY